MYRKSLRPLRLLAVFVVLALAGAACGNDEEGSSSGSVSGSGSASGTGTGAADLDLVSDGKLTVCSDVPYAPFEFEESGTLKGIDIDLVKAMAGKLDLEAEFRDTDFDGIFSALAAGQCDMIASSVSITDERKQNNDFTDGYFEINQSLLVRKGEESTIKDLPDLKGKTVGVQSETTGAAYAESKAKDNGYTVKEFTGADELFTALKAKQVDAVLQDFPINSYNAEKTGESAVAKVFEEQEKEEYGFVVKKGNTSLRDALDDVLDELREDGTYDDILEEYLGTAA